MIVLARTGLLIAIVAAGIAAPAREPSPARQAQPGYVLRVSYVEDVWGYADDRSCRRAAEFHAANPDAINDGRQRRVECVQIGGDR